MCMQGDETATLGKELHITRHQESTFLIRSTAEQKVKVSTSSDTSVSRMANYKQRLTEESEFVEAFGGDLSLPNYHFPEEYNLSTNSIHTDISYQGVRGRCRRYDPNGLLVDKVYCPIKLPATYVSQRKKRFHSKSFSRTTQTVFIIAGDFQLWEYYCPMKLELQFIEPEMYVLEDDKEPLNAIQGSVYINSIEVTLKSYERRQFNSCEETYQGLIETFSLVSMQDLNYYVDFDNDCYETLSDTDVTAYRVYLDCLRDVHLPVLTYNFEGIRYFTLNFRIGISTYGKRTEWQSGISDQIVYRELMFPVEVRETGLFVDSMDGAYSETIEDFVTSDQQPVMVQQEQQAPANELPSYGSLYPSH